MATPLDRPAPLVIPHLHRNRLLAILALLAVGASVGFFWWSFKTKAPHLSLAAGIELNYRDQLKKILCEEATDNGLVLDIQSKIRAKDAIARVSCGELDAAVIPAGLGVPGENVRQVAMLECEVLHLFVKPEIFARGIAGLRGCRLYLGPEGGGVRIIAGEILKFILMRPGREYQDDARSYPELMATAPELMPDGVFSLSPLPSPLGEKLANQYGYQLMELPFGEALALRKPYFEDACVPANTYGVHPAVPERPLHTVGTRSVLIAHCDVPKVAIRRLLETLYESDFARRVGMQPLNAKLLERSGEYPNHAGTVAYLHRHDPWVNTDLIENLKSLRGMIVSVISAAFLAWQWYKRRGVGGADDYLRVCNKLELDALQASSRCKLGEAELHRFLAEAAELKVDVLEKHQEGVLAGDRALTDLISRIEHLQQTLPTLALAAGSRDPAPLGLAPPRRRAG